MPGFLTAAASTTPAIPLPARCRPEKSSITAPSTFIALGTDPAADPLIFQPAEKEHWPGVSLSPDGRWLLVSVARTFDETDLYLQDLASDAGMVAVARDLPATFDGEIAHGRLFLRTNLDAPTYRLYVVRSRTGPSATPGGRLSQPGATRSWTV